MVEGGSQQAFQPFQVDHCSLQHESKRTQCHHQHRGVSAIGCPLPLKTFFNDSG
ncbi:Hypothetical protein P9303_14201 [Prochlorococcus marinus str. MIT 9303]|uniref:Uncharacterized protein n=1 Tax=Prochlorococcus marinus (strain MIT 9303) TaxID=59922 RepID=A2C9K6_PROM3|nr:Hypothetical protein P9303_14201 [Prochlorococcus marinus str. MIT 9303]